MRALEERVAGLFGHEAALFTPTGSMANVLAVRSLVGARPGGALRGLAPTSPGPSSARTGRPGVTMRTWIHPRGRVDLPAIATLFAPDLGPFFVPHRGDRGREHPQLRRRRRCCRSPSCAALREFADGVGVGVHLDGARIWNAHVATGVPLARVRRDRRRARGLPLQGARRPGRVADGRAARRRSREARVLAQADGRRDAPGRHPRRGRAARPRPPRRAARRGPRSTPGCWPRRAASTRPRCDTNIVVVAAPGRRRLRSPRAREAGRAGRDGRPTTVRLVTHLDVSGPGVTAGYEGAAVALAALWTWGQALRAWRVRWPGRPRRPAGRPPLRPARCGAA